MKLKNHLTIIVLIMLYLVPITLSAQYFDYHREESPAVTWNGLPLFDARLMGAGGISFMASDAFLAAINPALILSVDRLTIGASYKSMDHEAFQYRSINQGPILVPNTLNQRLNKFSGLAVTLPYKHLHFSAGYYTANLPELPPVDIQQDSFGYTGTFPGIERTFFAAAALKLSETAALGIKLDYVRGEREVDTHEEWKEYPLQMFRQESHRLSYFAPSIGVSIKLSPAWKVGAAVKWPLRGKARRSLDRIFESEFDRVEITGLKSTDSLYRPARINLGMAFTPFEARGKGKKNKTVLTLAGEAVYTLWPQYKYEYFSEFPDREMRGTMALALGIEFSLLRNRNAFSARLGYRLDPQPVTQPKVNLQAVSGGLGIKLGRIALDLAVLYYFGSAGGVSQQHVVMNSSLGFILGGKK